MVNANTRVRTVKLHIEIMSAEESSTYKRYRARMKITFLELYLNLVVEHIIPSVQTTIRITLNIMYGKFK